MDHNLSNLTIGLMPNASSVSTPSAPIKFLVTMVTMSRKETSIKFNFGDGVEKSFLLKEEVDELAEDNSMDRVRLTASYGQGCTLNVEIDHMFSKQGHFRPLVVATNTISNVSARLSSAIDIFKELEGASIQVPEAVAINRTVNITVMFLVASMNITYNWSITSPDNNTQRDLITSQPIISMDFVREGVYKILVSAHNPINSLKVERSVIVEIPVKGLTLTSTQSHFLLTGSTFVFRARISQGTQVAFRWSLPEENAPETYIINDKQNSTASHVFRTVGAYNISVQAFNRVSQLHVNYSKTILVQNKVTGLTVFTPGPVLLGNVSLISAMVASGSDVRFDVDYGLGREGINKTLPHRFLWEHSFPLAASYAVQIYAFNHVSMVTKMVEVEVQAPIGDVTLTTCRPVLIGQPSLFVAKIKGKNVYFYFENKFLFNFYHFYKIISSI